MILTVIREPSVNGATFGSLYLDGHWQCFTLEDQVREPFVKVPGQTAIPAGRYRVLLTMSARFQRVLPLLSGVPHFEGIRIHAGNAAWDTEGCILVGMDRQVSQVLRSRVALDALLERLRAEPSDLWVDVRNWRAQAA